MNFLFILTVLLPVWAASSKQLFTTIEKLYNNGERIIEGTPAKPRQFPWQAAVRFKTSPSESHFCGGSIISDQWILTAGHCSADALSFTITLGITDLKSGGALNVSTNEHITHEGYNSYLNNDIALIKLGSPIEFNDNVQPIQLPKRGHVVLGNEEVTVSGWGKTSDESNVVSPHLNFVKLTTIENDKCALIYGYETIIPSTLCAVGHPNHNTCNGDSGGPLVQYDSHGKATQVGVVSFVHSDGCASGNPSGYVRTESYLDWIVQNTGLDL